MLAAARAQTSVWYREPFVWMLIAFPALSVLGGISMIFIAVASNDGLVVDDYYRQGKQINRVLARDAAARTMDVRARFQFEDDRSFTLALRANDPDVLTPELELRLSFATQAGHDQSLRLQRDGDGLYRGQFPDVHDGRWYLQLETPQWRLREAVQMPLAKDFELIPRADD